MAPNDDRTKAIARRAALWWAGTAAVAVATYAWMRVERDRSHAICYATRDYGACDAVKSVLKGAGEGLRLMIKVPIALILLPVHVCDVMLDGCYSWTIESSRLFF
jgi:hypothetical protein